MTIWEYQRKISRRLLAWSGFSMFIGVGMVADIFKPLRAMGLQFLQWGLIDALIAIVGQRFSGKRFQKLDDPLSSDVVAKEKRNLSRILWVNAGLDIGYMLFGAKLVKKSDEHDDPTWGHGYGIIFQGAFLFLFDVFHALKLRRLP